VLDSSAPRYKGRPLLFLLDAYALALIGAMAEDDETRIAAVVRQALGPGTWKETVRRSAGLPADMDQRILSLWQTQPNGVSAAAFVKAVSDENFAPLIDSAGDERPGSTGPKHDSKE
jgi:hypothetical protein